MSQEELEIKKLELEEKLFAEETRRADRDAALKQQELDFQREQFDANKKGWRQLFTPLGAAIFAGLIGLAGTVITGRQNLALEREKLKATQLLDRHKQEGDLILKLAEISKDERDRARNVLFFAEGKYLTMAESYKTYLRQTAGLGKDEPVPPPSAGASQEEFLRLNKAGKTEEAFNLAFHKGDELFKTEFTATLRGARAQACRDCHNRPYDGGAGSLAVNQRRDPLQSGRPEQMIERNTPHLFGIGALQLLAEEMNAELEGIRKAVVDAACSTGQRVERPLTTKTVDFGYIAATCPHNVPDIDDSRIIGVAADLVIRPFQWKKSVIFLRDFTRASAVYDLGLNVTELSEDRVSTKGADAEAAFSIGDTTALAIFVAAQPRPTTKTELADLGLIPTLSNMEREAIDRGQKVFHEAGCVTCHKPDLALVSTVYTEPSRSPAYRDAVFGSGKGPAIEGVDWENPVSFDVSKDVPDNRIHMDGGQFLLGSFTEKDSRGRTIVHLYGDLKRHDMGPELAEGIDETGTGGMGSVQYLRGKAGSTTGPSTFGTKELWGVACTGPWWHDGRAATLRQAIEFHGGEAATSREDFRHLDQSSRKDLIVFLQNLVLYKKGGTESTLPEACSPKE